jgi:predicted metal-dependent peptidase
MEDGLLRKIQQARSEAEGIWPYISSILFELRLVRVDDPSFRTLAVDKGWRLYWSPDFVDKCDIPQLATSLLHECMHCLLDHADRFDELDTKTKDFQLWNIVGDCSINETLEEEMLGLPNHIRPVRFEDFDGVIDKSETPERNYFKLLEDKCSNSKSNGDQDKNSSSSADQPDTPNQHQDPGSTESPDQPDCGSIAGGSARPYEIEETDEHAPAIDSGTKALATGSAIDAIIHGRDYGPKAGRSLVRAVEELLRPRISWRQKLASVLRQSLGNMMGRSDYTIMRISRRESAIGTPTFKPRLPAMRGPLPPTVAVILDTSPSITDSHLKEAISEIIGIVRAVGVSKSIAVIPCSYFAYDVQYVRTETQVQFIRPDGDDGTDLRKGFESASQLKKIPEVVVVITDGYTEWPKEKPKGVKLVIVLLNNATKIGDLKPWMVPIIQES